MDTGDAGGLPAPGEDGWRTLCSAAEASVDADPRRYEEDWLAATLTHLEGRPGSLRRCPDRWFRVPRPRADLLLRLGAVTAADLSDRPAVRCADERSVSSVCPPTGWTVFTTDDLEFFVDGDDARPDPVGLQVAWFVASRWIDIEGSAEDVLNEAASDWDDYYALAPVPPRGAAGSNPAVWSSSRRLRPASR